MCLLSALLARNPCPSSYSVRITIGFKFAFTLGMQSMMIHDAIQNWSHQPYIVLWSDWFSIFSAFVSGHFVCLAFILLKTRCISFSPSARVST